MANETESRIIDLIAADRLHIPLSSMEGKLKRMKPKLAGLVDLPNGKYDGARVYARVVPEDQLKSRTITQAVEKFCTEYPKYGDLLTQMIEDTRVEKENHLYFGMKPEARLTADDYLSVMTSMGFSELQATNLYGPLMEASRSISKKRADGERSLLVG